MIRRRCSHTLTVKALEGTLLTPHTTPPHTPQPPNTTPPNTNSTALCCPTPTGCNQLGHQSPSFLLMGQRLIGSVASPHTCESCGRMPLPSQLTKKKKSEQSLSSTTKNYNSQPPFKLSLKTMQKKTTNPSQRLQSPSTLSL